VYKTDPKIEKEMKRLKKIKYVDDLQEYQNKIVTLHAKNLSTENIRSLAHKLKELRELSNRLNPDYDNLYEYYNTVNKSSKRTEESETQRSKKKEENTLNPEAIKRRNLTKKRKNDDITKIAPFIPDFLVDKFREKLKLK
jgi:hypothetical protein